MVVFYPCLRCSDAGRSRGWRWWSCWCSSSSPSSEAAGATAAAPTARPASASVVPCCSCCCSCCWWADVPVAPPRQHVPMGYRGKLEEQARAREDRAQAAKGDNCLKFANSDPRMINVFCAWLRHFLDVDESRL